MKRILSILTLVACIAVLLGLSPHGATPAYSATAQATDSGTASAATPAGTESAGYTGPLDSELNVYNWADYIDEDLLKEYTAKYNVKINYDNYASNEELLAKIQGGATGYDVIFPSDYMVATMISLGLLAKMDMNNIPNRANLDPYNLNTWYDPNNEYCLPWQWGTTGLAYHVSVKDPPTSWSAIFDPDQAKAYAAAGGINMLDDEREAIGAALKYLGYSVNDADPAHLAQARDTIIKILPYIHSFNSEDYQTTLLIPKEVILSQAWNGDAANAAISTKDAADPQGQWKFVTPKEGGVRWQDSVCILASSKHKATAEHFINFIIDGQAAARTSNITGYVSANKAAKPFTDPEVLAFAPSADALSRLEWIKPLDDATSKLYDQTWTEIRAAQ